jgi:hypothetical protein
MTLYDASHQAFKLGWGLIKSVPVLGDGIQAPGAVTMCERDDFFLPYIVHFFNAQDGGFHSGDYCPDREAAEEAYAARVLRFHASIEPWDTDGDTSKWNENGEGSEADNDRRAPRD